MHPEPGWLTHLPLFLALPKMSTHKAWGMLVFLTTPVSIWTAPCPYNVNPSDLLRWPPNFGFHLVWKALRVFKLTSHWKKSSLSAPSFVAKRQLEGAHPHSMLEEHIYIRFLLLALPTVFAPPWPTLFLSSRCLIDWGQVSRGCLPWRLLFWRKVGIGGNDTSKLPNS